MSNETPLLQDPLAARPLVLARPWASILALAGVLLLGLGVWPRLFSKAPKLEGPIQSWTKPEQKQALADYLAAQVKAPGFSAELHVIKKGQNYWSVARNADISIDSLVGFNLDMAHLDAYIGRPLLVSESDGALHQVQVGDSPASVEKDYGLEAGQLRAANRIGWLGLKQGQVLFLPGMRPRQLTEPMAALFERRRLFRSPLAGKYTSLVGTRLDPFTGNSKNHNGVDIKAPFNALVASAAAGKVSMAGWNSGLGKCVIIEHANGFRTIYGHLNTVLVKQGQSVKTNQYVGKVGMTGRTTGPHLHFAIYKDGKLQNPLKYLW